MAKDKKSDMEQLEGILKQFDDNTILKVIEGLGLSLESIDPKLRRLFGRRSLIDLARQQQAVLRAITYQPHIAAALPAAAGGIAIRAAAKEAAKEVGLWILEWALGKTLDASVAAVAAGEASTGWRADGENEIVNDGNGENYFSDSIAPTIVSTAYTYNGCCEELTRGIKIQLKLRVSDAGGDWFENDTGVKTISVSAVRESSSSGESSTGEAQTTKTESKQVGNKELNATEADTTDDDSAEFSVDLCIPCGYIVDNKVTLMIKVADWNRNTRIRRETLDLNPEKVAECCG